MRAAEAKEVTQYKSKNGKIVEIKPICSKKEFGDKVMPNSVPYRTMTNGRIMYGWLHPDYELKDILDAERIPFQEDVKPEVPGKPKKVRAFNISQYIKSNISKTEEEIVKDLEKARSDGLSVRCKGPLQRIVRDYRRSIIKKMADKS